MNLNPSRRRSFSQFLVALFPSLLAGLILMGPWGTGNAQSPATSPSADAAEAGPVTAILLGDELRLEDADRVRAVVLGRLLRDYVAENEIQATDEEIFTSVGVVEQRMKSQLGDDYQSIAELPANEQGDELAFRTNLAGYLVLQWKMNKALFDEYGGRVVMLPIGPEPLDAQRAFLEAHLAAGDFKLVDKDINAGFWNYFTDNPRHRFLSEEEGEAIFGTPPWAPD